MYLNKPCNNHRLCQVASGALHKAFIEICTVNIRFWSTILMPVRWSLIKMLCIGLNQGWHPMVMQYMACQCHSLTSFWIYQTIWCSRKHLGRSLIEGIHAFTNDIWWNVSINYILKIDIVFSGRAIRTYFADVMLPVHHITPAPCKCWAGINVKINKSGAHHKAGWHVMSIRGNIVLREIYTLSIYFKMNFQYFISDIDYYGRSYNCVQSWNKPWIWQNKI